MTAKAPPAESASTGPVPPAGMAAIVNGHSITVEALEQRRAQETELGADFEGTDERALFTARYACLQRLIDEALLADLARQQGTSFDELKERVSREVVVTDKDVERAYTTARTYRGDDVVFLRRKERFLAGSEEEVRARLREFLHKEWLRIKLAELARPLREDATITIYLQEPQAARERKAVRQRR